MKSRNERPTLSERLYCVLLLLYPPAFHAEYGDEMLVTFREWSRERPRGSLGVLMFWGTALMDLARSLPREWASALHSTRMAGDSPADPYRPPHGPAALVGLAVLTLYVVTLAPTVAFWDAGEYITVAHLLGIPHPPGSSLFVLLAHAWETLLAPTGLSTAVRINLFSAVLSAAAHALWFLVMDRALATPVRERLLRRIAAASAVVLSATAFTVWNQSDVNEKIYMISFLTTALVTWLLLRWRDGRSEKLLLVIAFLLALTATNHLMGVLVVPALLLFVFLVDRRVLLRPRLWILAAPLVGIALSVQFFLPLRAAQGPIISEGEPVCESITEAAKSVYTWGATGCEALSAVLSREQYGKPSVLLDPTVYPQQYVPRSGSLLVSQFVNYFQYLDWQWARSIAGGDPLFGGVRPLFTLGVLLLGLLGARTHWKADRQSAAYLGTLFLTLSAGLVLYLNFRYGYSIARDRFPEASMHEVRERDYFFLIGFSVWGLWVGVGLAAAWQWAADALRSRVPRPRLAAAPVLSLALLPLALNWSWASRANDYTARDWAYNVLMSVEPYGVLITNGDNDTFPLWYLQEVEGIRQDVTVMVTAYLNTPWYIKQLRDLTQPCPPGVNPAEDPTRIVCQRPFRPGDLPQPLIEAGWARAADPPPDSVLPLSDEEIHQLAQSYFVAQEPLLLRAGNIDTVVAPGTTILPADAFAAVMLKATIGERPIHFMPGSPIAQRLGLYGHTVRQGITWKIHNGSLPADAREGVILLPESQISDVAGAAINLPITDTLVWEVYLRRGRIMDTSAPWVDAATTSILVQYAYTHYAAAQGHALRDEEAAVERHMRRADWWMSIADS